MRIIRPIRCLRLSTISGDASHRQGPLFQHRHSNIHSQTNTHTHTHTHIHTHIHTHTHTHTHTTNQRRKGFKELLVTSSRLEELAYLRISAQLDKNKWYIYQFIKYFHLPVVFVFSICDFSRYFECFNMIGRDALCCAMW